MDDPTDEDLVKPPPILQEWMDGCKTSLRINKTRTKTAAELNPLIWKSFTQEFTLDPKTLHELVTLRPSQGRAQRQFMRELTPENVHWHGTKVHFVHHQQLVSFLRPGKQVCLLCVPT
jgi:hypothetical protein